MYTNIKDFLINENIKQMREYLHANGLEQLEDSLGFIKEKFKKKPNYISIFTKIMVDKKGEIHGTKEQFDEVADWIINRNHLVSKLPKKIQEYTSLEEIQDDIRKIDIGDLVNKFYHSLYPEMREKIEKLGHNDRESMDNTAASFMLLDKDLRKSFPPLKYFKQNNLTIFDLKNSMINFIETGEVNASKIGVMSVIDGNDKANIVYNENDVLIIQTNDMDVILKLGSNRWCIVYSPNNYFHQYVGGDGLYAQFICFNFNLPQSNKNSLFGVSLDMNNDSLHGGCQDRENNEYNLPYVCSSLGLTNEQGLTIFTNPFIKVISDIITSEDSIKKVMEYAKIYDSEEMIAMCDKDQIKVGIISQVEEMLSNTTSNLFGDEFNLYNYMESLGLDFESNEITVGVKMIILIGMAVKHTKIGMEQFSKFIPDHLGKDVITQLIPDDYYNYPDNYQEYADTVDLFGIEKGYDYTAFDYIVYNYTSKDTKIRNDSRERLAKALDLDENNISTFSINEIEDLEFLYSVSLDIIKDPDTYEYYSQTDDWEHSLDFSARTVLAIYNKLLIDGVELDVDKTELYERIKDSEFNSLNYTKTLELYKENGEFIKAIRTLDKYIIDIIRNPEEYGEEAEDSVDSIRESLNDSKRNAYENKVRDEYYDNFISSLSDVFIPQENENGKSTMFKYTDDNNIILKVDVFKIINEDPDNLEQLVRDYGEDFEVNDVLKFYANDTGELTFSEPDYVSIDQDILNDYILDAL